MTTKCHAAFATQHAHKLILIAGPPGWKYGNTLNIKHLVYNTVRCCGPRRPRYNKGDYFNFGRTFFTVLTHTQRWRSDYWNNTHLFTQKVSVEIIIILKLLQLLNPRVPELRNATEPLIIFKSLVRTEVIITLRCRQIFMVESNFQKIRFEIHTERGKTFSRF